MCLCVKQHLDASWSGLTEYAVTAELGELLGLTQAAIKSLNSQQGAIVVRCLDTTRALK